MDKLHNGPLSKKSLFLNFYPVYHMMIDEGLGLEPDHGNLDTWLCIPSVK